MLYVSTRNTVDTYTAYRALHETATPDGGVYVPFRLPTFSKEEMQSFRERSGAEVVAQLLNQFFGLSLSKWDVEGAAGRSPFKLENMNHKLLVAELWHNADGSFTYLLKKLYAVMTGQSEQMPVGWSRIALEIAFLFGIFTSIPLEFEEFDVAVTAGDFAEITAIRFAKDMGLPVNLVVCACDENSGVWDLVNRGELRPENTKAAYLEAFLFKAFGADCVTACLNAVNCKQVYRIDEEQLEMMNQFLYAAVVGDGRIETVKSGIYRINQYHADANMALAYGALQDYRSDTGVSRDTLILEKYQPKG